MIHQWYLDVEKRLSYFLKGRSITMLRYSMAIIYFWFGLLKLAGISPVEELVYHATHWTGAHNFVLFLGVWEMAIGFCLAIKEFNRYGLILLFLQFPGTFLPLFLNPEDTFTIIPYGLTLEGQYIFKNLVMISAGLILIANLHSKGHSEMK